MLKKLFEQYQIQNVLIPLIEAGAPQTAWWVVDEDNTVMFRTVDRQPPDDGLVWPLSQHGTLRSEETYPKIRSLGDVMAQLLTTLLHSEIQRLADETQRQAAQLEAQTHYRISNILGTLTRYEDISERLMQETLALIGAAGAVLYRRQPNGEFQLEAVVGQTPYGDRPPSLLRKGLLHHVAASGETVWLNDMPGHEMATPTERHAHNVLALTIHLQEFTYGVIALFDHAEGFSSHHMRLLRILVHHAAIAYHHAAANLALAGAESDWQEVFEHSELDWQELNE